MLETNSINTILFIFIYSLHGEAINYAFKQKDLPSLYEVQTKIQLLQNPVLNDEVDSHIAKLEGRH